MIPEGPSSYGSQALTDASGLAMKMVANYGMTEMGITTFAPSLDDLGSSSNSYETSVDQIDDGMFGSGGDGFENPVSEVMVGRMKQVAQLLLLEAYSTDLVHFLPPNLAEAIIKYS